MKTFYVVIKSELFWQSVFLLSPFIFLACIFTFGNSLPCEKIGLSFQIFTVIPLVLPIWEKAHRSVWQFDWYVMQLGNWFGSIGWRHISAWLHHYNSGKFVLIYLMTVAILFYVIGLLLQMFA